jgi:hypothetical protein
MAKRKMSDEWESVSDVKQGDGWVISKGNDGKFAVYDDLTGDFYEFVFDSASEAESYARSKYGKLSQGDGMDKEKMKKKLMEKEKLSEKEADEKLAKMSEEDQKNLAAEVDEDEKKMAAENDEEKMSEEEVKKFAAHREQRLAAKKDLVKLAGEIKGGFSNVRLAQKKVAISTRLSKLRAAAKVTPAEIKKINLSELAGKSDDALESYFKAFEVREPQVMVGMVGDRNASEGAEVAKKQRLAAMQNTVLQGMPFMSQVIKNKRLAEGEQEGSQDSVSIHVDTDPHTDMMEDDEHMSAIEKMMDEDMARAKQMFREYCKKMKSRMTDSGTNDMGEGGEKAVEELASEMKKMHTQNEQLLELVAKLTGETV